MSNDTQPEIRFPGFTDDWEQRKLRDVSNYSNGGSYESDVENRGKYELITLKSVDMFGNLVSSGKFINKKVPTLNKGTLVMILSEQSPGLLGMTAQIPKDDTFVLNQRVAEIHPNDDTNGYFLSMAINRSQAYFSKRGAGTKVQNISKSNVENFEFFIPIKHEQQKIGTFFKNLDDTIALHQRKLDLLKETKKGFLQKMFPKNGAKVPEIRFPGFTEDWEQRKLGDLTTWTKGQGLTKEDLNKERDGSEAVHYADLYKFSPVMHEVIHWTNSDDGRIIPDNSLLFPASDVTPVGLARTSTLRLSGVKAGGDVIIGQLNESINSSFMSYQINANSKKILPLITGTTVKHIQAKSLATVSVSITNMAEQTAIAGIFEQLDDTITLHQRKLDLLKETKKGFLQKMFV
ncbi:restriction endonuclease subunit S [Enterococcus faecalis]|uniref:restriction endonuclease subunit S n=1 Tax=Enterococcus faecalis TaxID=1351 RepID=UPI0022E07E63|nr:restriction endonuclease subunit S [Enterococcus faecalis]